MLHSNLIKHLLKSVLAGLFAVGAAWAGFLPSVRVDHENRPNYGCFHAAITLGLSPLVSQPVYVVFQDDSMVGMVSKRADILFQKSTDGGATWLAQDLLIKRGNVFACYPDITTDSEGAVYIVYTEGVDNLHSHAYCVRSTDGGATWSASVAMDDNANPTAIGWARIVPDSADNLFAAWNGNHDGLLHIWSSVSTDHGATWSPNVRVDDDTVPMGSYHTDIAVQPATDHYLVVASAPYWIRPGQIGYHSYFYRSTDAGSTFEPGVQLDSFDGYCGQPHVVADAEHIICDYSGSMQASGSTTTTEARTLYSVADTWGSRVPVTKFDSLHASELNGNNLAISPDGRVHVALMIYDFALMADGILYGFSADHGATWSERERVNEDSVDNQSDPDIAVDAAASAYLVWQDGRGNRQTIRFSTNSPLGVEESHKPQATSRKLGATVVRGVLSLGPGSRQHTAYRAELLDAAGRRVMDIFPGANDVNSLAPGVYFVREAASGRRSAVGVRKVIVAR